MLIADCASISKTEVMKWLYGYNSTLEDRKVCNYCNNIAQYAFSPKLYHRFEAPHNACTNRECRCVTVMVGREEYPPDKCKMVTRLLRKNHGYVRLSEVDRITDG